MLDYIYRARWDQALAFLASGHPPIYLRLMALNALFLAIYAIRKAVDSPLLPSGMGFFVQLAMFGANLLVLYQAEVQDYLWSITSRI